MVKLADMNHTTLSIINNRTHMAEMRPYIGGSQVGHPCSRYLWYSFRWCYQEKLTNRMYRLFNRGHREEEIFIENLRYAGINCYGFQAEITFAYGHGKGHIDGLGINVREAHKAVHLLEFKTMNDKYFNECVKSGVEKSKPEYYAQTQIYMSKLNGVERTLFCAVNKNTDDYYIERLRFDPAHAEFLERKAEAVVLAEVPPKRLSDNPTYYICKFCAACDICHNGKPPLETCRTCAYVGLENEGYWSCTNYGIYLANDQQRLGCDNYELQVME